MRALYSLIIGLCSPFVLLYFAVRGIGDTAYLRRWGERFGRGPAPSDPGGILVHAASMGEFNAAAPLIRRLLEAWPELPLTVTTVTPAGSRRVTSTLGERVTHSYLPLDLPGAMGRFLDRVKPSLVIIIETEIWPNLYRQAHRRGIPVAIANARLSKRSASRFRYVSGLVQNALGPVAWLGAQSADDLARLVRCGAQPERAVLTGNLKFDLELPAGLAARGASLREKWGGVRPVLVAGSTHEADENVIFAGFSDLLRVCPSALLIVVPRYAERFSRVAQRAEAAGFRTERYSQGESCSERAQCFVIDTIGELLTYYACADATFVGGSFGDQGGHNPLEPAALGKPVLLGPNMENAREIADQLLDCGAAVEVTTPTEFCSVAERIFSDPQMRKDMGRAGRDLVHENKGALEATIGAARRLLGVEPRAER